MGSFIPPNRFLTGVLIVLTKKNKSSLSEVLEFAQVYVSKMHRQET